MRNCLAILQLLLLEMRCVYLELITTILSPFRSWVVPGSVLDQLEHRLPDLFQKIDLVFQSQVENREDSERREGRTPFWLFGFKMLLSSASPLCFALYIWTSTQFPAPLCLGALYISSDSLVQFPPPI